MTFAQIATVGSGVTSFADAGLTASTQYSYRVRATNLVGDSGYSNTATVTTQAVQRFRAPSNLAAAAVGSSTVNLTWTDGSNNETGFKIERATGRHVHADRDGSAGVTSHSNSGRRSTQYPSRPRHQ